VSVSTSNVHGIGIILVRAEIHRFFHAHLYLCLASFLFL
jgi:hypothetical protein